MISVGGEDQVIVLPILGEILPSVIYDMVCTYRAHHVHLARAAHTGYLGPERFGDLHGERTHTTGRAVDQNLLTLLDLSFIAKPLQGGGRRRWYGSRFLERHLGRFRGQSVFTGTRTRRNRQNRPRISHRI